MPRSPHYHSRRSDRPTILMALLDIVSQQATPTENTKKQVNQLLDYMWTHPNAKIRYPPSNMIFNVHSYALYLSAPHALSRTGDYFFLGSLHVDGNPIKLNGAIHITCTILKVVAVSTTEAELGALFLNAQEAKVLRLALNKLGHPQPPTPIHNDNTTTVALSLTLSIDNIPVQWEQDISGFWMEKHNNTSSFIISPVKKTWAIIHLNTTQQTFTSMSGHIMCIPTSPLLSSPGPLSPAFGKGVLKSWGTHTPRSPHYHVLGSPLGSLSPEAFLVTKYWASLAYSIGYHLLTSVQKEYH
jgi:hypothetical protein